MKKLILAIGMMVFGATAAMAQVGNYIPQNHCSDSDYQTPPWGHTYSYYASTSVTSNTTSWTYTYTTTDAVQPFQHHNSKWPTMGHYGYSDSDYRACTVQY